jgi:ppGpp synthetase/RelA/SpoT-type nucleotidyltranferase
MTGSSETLRRLREYSEGCLVYKRVCDIAVQQAKKMLDRRGVPFASVTGRVKSFHSISEHLRGKTVRAGQFMTAVKDAAGVRIVLWRPSDRSAIARDIHEIFEVDGGGTKEALLRRSADGYSDDKYRCTLRPGRGVSADLRDLAFELQVQTAMMNAWASIGHDISYKASFAVSYQLRRRFELLAALTDLADDNMNALTKDVISEATTLAEERLNVPGLTARLNEVIATVDSNQKVLCKFADAADARAIVEELRKCGIARMDDLRQLINQNTVKRCLTAAGGELLNYSSIARLVLMMQKLDQYFKRVMWDVVVLDTDWLRVLKCLNVDYRGAARRVGKAIYITDQKGRPRLIQ